MLRLVNFKMPLTCFMSPEGEEAVGWDDGRHAGVVSLHESLGSGISVHLMYSHVNTYMLLFISLFPRCHTTLP